MDASNKNEEDFETSDIYLASYLSVAGCTVKNLRRQGARVYIVFTSPTSIRDLRESYYAGKALVRANAMSAAIQSMKELVCGSL